MATNNVMVWDGKRFTLATPGEAKKLVAKGGYEIATHKDCNKLKTFDQLQAEKKKKPRQKKKAQTYKTRDMKAAAHGSDTDISELGIPGVEG